jgi:putative protein-disulfide isomerase
MKIKYFFDPLCGWCYGASQSLEKAESLGIKVEVYPVGIFAARNGRAMSSDFAQYAWTNDQRIQEMTGQVFSEAYRINVLSNTQIRFDSWMPTIAIIAHESRFKNGGLKFLREVQKARYVDGLDNTNLYVLSDIANSFGWNSSEFISLLADEKFQLESRLKILENLAAYENYRSKGVPLIVIEENGEERILKSSLVFNKNPNPVEWFATGVKHV